MLIKENDYSDLRGSPPHLTTPPSFDIIDNGTRDFPCMPAFKFGPFTRAGCEMTPLQESPRRNLKARLPRENMTSQKCERLQCTSCGIKFNNPSNLEVHLTLSRCNKARIHEAEKRYFLPDTTGSKKRELEEGSSPFDSPKKVLKTDAGQFSPKTPPSTTFQSDKSVVIQKRHESPPLTGAFRCQMCSYTADKQSRLVDHMSKEHTDETNESSEMEVDSSPKPIALAGSDSCERNEPVGEWFCEQCDIRFSAIGNYRAHKEFYCGTRTRRKSTGSPASRQARSPKFVTNHMGLYPGYVPTILPAVMPVPPGMHLVPMLTPFGMTYAMQCVLPTNPQQNAVKSTSPAKKESEQQSKEANDNDQPLDLSVKRNEPPTSDDSAPKAKSRRTSDPGAYLSRFNNWRVSNPPRFYSPVGTLSTDKKHSLASGIQGLISPVVLPNVATDVSRCDDCDIVFYKHENYKVHKELYCAGRRGKETIQIRPNLKTPPLSPKVSVPRTPESATHSPSAKNHPRASPTLSVASANSRDASTPEEYAMQYFCVPCKIKFSSLDTLEAHQLYYCPASKALAEHASLAPSLLASKSPPSLDDKRPFTCLSCSAPFSTKNDLATHLCTHTTMKIPMFCCPYCEYVAQSDNRLLDHIKAHAPTKAYRCDLCGYRGNTVRGMRMHGKTHIDAGESFTDDHMIEYDEPPLIPKRLRTVTESVEIKVPSELLRVNLEQIRKRTRVKATSTAKHFCSQCRVSFTDSFAFQAHLQIHKDEFQFSCNDCEYKTTQKDELEKHIKLAHYDELRRQMFSSEEKKLSKHTIKNILDASLVHSGKDAQISGTSDHEFESHSSDEENRIRNNSPLTKVSQPAKRPGTPLSPSKENIFLSNNPSPTLKNSNAAPLLLGKGERVHYCKQCDIPFVYLSTYLAHKKYYCSSHAGERNVETPAEV